MWSGSGAIHSEHTAEAKGAGRAQTVAGWWMEAGEGLFARRRFDARESVLDYAFMNGVNGEKVDHLNEEERWLRYPALPGNPEGTGKYLLKIGNGRLYLDALKQEVESIQGAQGIRRTTSDNDRCGLGGKANTNPGKQNARFKGSKIIATRVIRIGEEIFVPYRRSYKFGQIVVDEERCGWGVVGRRFYRDMG